MYQLIFMSPKQVGTLFEPGVFSLPFNFSIHDYILCIDEHIAYICTLHETIQWPCCLFQNWCQRWSNFKMERSRRDFCRWIDDWYNASATFTPRNRLPRMLLGECRKSVEGGSARCIPYIHLPQVWGRHSGQTWRIGGGVHHEIYSDDDC